MSAQPTPQHESNLPRRFVLGGSAVAAAAGVSALLASPAEAATAATTWKLGGNPGVSTDGTNFLGTTNAAPLIFKTTPSTGTTSERMRITPTGLVGIGTTGPTTKLDVKTTAATAVRGTTTNTSLDATAISGVGGNATGVTGASSGGFGVRGTSVSSYGVEGVGGYTGVRGEGQSYGGIFTSTTEGSIGLYATGSGYALYGAGGTYGAYAVGSTYGVYGAGPTGLYGSGSTGGVVGTTSNLNGNAVYGTGGQYGVHGENARTAGIRGDSGYVGAWGQAPTYAVYGLCTATGTDQGYGLFGQSSNAASYALWSQGNAHIAGTLSKAAGSFKIDHPLDPDHQWLSHSFVESPDMMNVYNGNVTLDGDGRATVDLPAYFGALNRDFRYQLTCVGGHAPVYVAAKVKDNAFSIAGGTPGLEVSWQVTGIRQDSYAKEHPIVVETAKGQAHQGTRQFVPKGSRAKPMKVGPGAASPQPAFVATKPEKAPVIR